jgi:hypothetical protein
LPPSTIVFLASPPDINDWETVQTIAAAFFASLRLFGGIASANRQTVQQPYSNLLASFA